LTFYVYSLPTLSTEQIARSGERMSAMKLGLTSQAYQGAEAISQSNIDALVQQGRDYYESGQFAQAATVWEQAASSFATQRDGLNQAMVLSNLSLAYQRLGQWTRAKDAIAKSLDLLQSTTDTSPSRICILAQALNTQGSLQLAQGQTEQALATWQKAEAAYQQANDEAGILRSQINQAQALKTLGCGDLCPD
jgi:tetratricopeptide (TPR) repeat protein